jgi:hypothetical protein
MTEETDKAYIAGIIDGEGSITVYSYSDIAYIKPLVNVTNTNKELLLWLKDNYRGSIYKQASKGSTYKTCYRWQLWGCHRILPMLRDVYPFLRLKKEQAYLLLNHPRFLKIEAMGNDHKNKNLSLTKEDKEENKKLLENIRKLNKQGV